MKPSGKLILAAVTAIITAMSAPLIPAAQESFRVWPGTPPAGQSSTGESEYTENDRVYHVNDPELIVYTPPADKANGRAIVVCPGGGYSRLAIAHEGHDIGRWLNSLGVAAFILKYRMYDYGQPAPLADVQRAIRVVRSRASDYSVDPAKIGLMGFSAGGHVASSGGVHFNDTVYEACDATDRVSARPDFLILIYGVITMQDSYTHAGSKKNLLGDSPDQSLVEFYSNERHITSDTPPTFLVHSTDDTTVPVKNSISFYQNCVKAGVKAEMHIFESGGHGYGMGRNGMAAQAWPGMCATWMEGLANK